MCAVARAKPDKSVGAKTAQVAEGDGEERAVRAISPEVASPQKGEHPRTHAGKNDGEGMPPPVARVSEAAVHRAAEGDAGAREPAMHPTCARWRRALDNPHP
jgi:hypothetical protein